MRLDKYLSDGGMSRSQARDAIARGRVRVDGVVAKGAGSPLPPGAQVTLDGEPVLPRGPLHLMMHKPQGVVTAREDRRLPTAFGLLPEALRVRDLSPVGRLDRDTTGLLLFTTNGQLAHRLISPRFAVEKSYLARVEGPLLPAHIDAMARGLSLSDFTARPAALTILEEDLGRLVIAEGKYHQVKRMFAALGCPVMSLHRERIGPVTLDLALVPGQFRPLAPEEYSALCALTGLEDT